MTSHAALLLLLSAYIERHRERERERERESGALIVEEDEAAMRRQ